MFSVSQNWDSLINYIRRKNRWSRNTGKRTFKPMLIRWVLSDMPGYSESYPELLKDKINEKYNYITYAISLLYPRKTSENQMFSDVFSGYRKRPLE